MTACNVFAATDAAYLLTDTAILDPTGRAWHFHPKVVQCERLRIAAGLTGDASVFELDGGQLASPLGAVEDVFDEAETQEDALSALPAALERAYAALHEMTGGAGNFIVMIALWDPAANEARAYIAQSPGVKQLPGLPTFELIRMAEFLSTSVDGGIDEPLRLIEAQRRKKAVMGSAAGFHTIGGEAQLTRIDRDGISTETLVRWPDRIGHKIDPHRRRWPSLRWWGR